MKTKTQAGRNVSSQGALKQSAKVAPASVNPEPESRAGEQPAPVRVDISTPQRPEDEGWNPRERIVIEIPMLRVDLLLIEDALRRRNEHYKSKRSLTDHINRTLEEQSRRDVYPTWPLNELESAVQEALGFIELAGHMSALHAQPQEQVIADAGAESGVMQMMSRTHRKLALAWKTAHAYAAGHPRPELSEEN